MNTMKYTCSVVLMLGVLMCWHPVEATNKQKKVPSALAASKLQKLRQYRKARQLRRAKLVKYKKWRLEKVKQLRAKREKYRKSQKERAGRIWNILKKHHEARLKKTNNK